MTGAIGSGEGRDVSLLAFDQYMRQVRQTAGLSPEEETALFQQMQEGRHEQTEACPRQWVIEQAKQARDRLVERYLPLVISIAKKYRGLCRHLELLDLIQEGNLGLLLALQRHQPGEGRSLLTFASLCIHQAVTAAVREGDPLVRLPKNVAREVQWLQQEKRQLEDYQGGEPTAQQLARQMKLPLERVQGLLSWSACQQVSSIQALLAESGEEEQMLFLAVSESAAPIAHPWQEQRRQAVRQAVEALPPRQREVIRLRYGLDTDSETMRSWPEVGQIVGLSVNSASASEYVGRRRLRHQLAPLCEGKPSEVA